MSAIHSDNDRRRGGGVPAGLVPPQSLEAEQSVLGAVLLSDHTMYALVIEIGLRPADFYRPSHAAVFEAMLALYEQGEPVDKLTVTEKLKQSGRLDDAGGAAAIEALAAAPPVVGNAGQYGKIVKETDARPRPPDGHLSHPAAGRRPQRCPARAARSRRAHHPRRRPRRPAQGLPRHLRGARRGDRQARRPLRRRQDAHRHAVRLQDDLDEITGGFQPGNLIILAARPSMGKSALAANFLENAAVRYNRPAVMFSLEMGESELAQRFMASQGSIKGNDLRRGKVAWPKVTAALKTLSAAPLYVDDSSDLSVLDVRAKARRLSQQLDGDLGLIVIDYLQLMRGSPQAAKASREQRSARSRVASRASRRSSARCSRSRSSTARSSSAPTSARSCRTFATRARSSRTPTS